MKKTTIAPIVFLVILSLVACGERTTTSETAEAPSAAESKPRAEVVLPSEEEALDVVSRSGPFSEFMSTRSAWSFPLDRSRANERVIAEARQLEAAGWLKLRPERIELTEKGSQDRRFLIRPNDTIDIVPIARKEIVKVDSVTAGDPFVLVDFTWRWVPNEVGSAFKSGPTKDRLDGSYQAVAKLDSGAKGWEVVTIDPKE